MRIWSPLKRIGLLATFAVLSIVFLILRSFNDISKESVAFDKSSLQLSSSSKWKVLSDGTVVHFGHFSDNAFKMISFDINSDICDHYSSDSSKLLILIESKSDNFERRRAIRQTWALKQRQEALNFRVAFLLGVSGDSDHQRTTIQRRIESESEESGDVIQINIIESFKNLTFKSVAGLHWFVDRCSTAQFYFKTDDDIFIETNNLIKSLKKFRASGVSGNSIFCHKNRNREIVRSYEKISRIMRSYRHLANRLATVRMLKEKLSKYKIHYSQLPGLYFPNYCSGFGYAMTRSVAQRLYSSALTIPYFMIEDVFVTGFCREKAGIGITDAKQLTLWPIVGPNEAKCALSDQRINSNELSIQELRSFWANIERNTTLCAIKDSHSNE